MTRKFAAVTGVVAPFILDDVNTDIIIPINHCVSTARSDLGKNAFESLRYMADGTDDPNFLFNKSPYRGAPVLLAGSNFGCGSSREPAVWALAGMGIKVIIAKSFGDIFYNNCLRNGVLPIVLATESHALLVQLCSGDAPVTATINLAKGEIILSDDHRFQFEMDPARRKALLEGLDDLEQTLLFLDDIKAFQRVDKQRRPWMWRPVQQDT